MLCLFSVRDCHFCKHEPSGRKSSSASSGGSRWGSQCLARERRRSGTESGRWSIGRAFRGLRWGSTATNDVNGRGSRRRLSACTTANRRRRRHRVVGRSSVGTSGSHRDSRDQRMTLRDGQVGDVDLRTMTLWHVGTARMWQESRWRWEQRG